MRSLLALVVCIAGCSLDVLPLGGDDRDGLHLKDTPVAYLADAVGDKTLAQVFDDGLAFAAKPDPTPLLAATAALDDDRPRAGKARLRVLDYNVALLDAQIFGVIDYKRSPDLDERRRALPDLALDGTFDIVCAQEVWKEQDLDTWTQKARARGYQAFAQDREQSDDGVMVFVRLDAIAGGTIPRLASHEPYASQDGTEYFPGPGIKRGYLEVELTHKEAGPVRVFCTHMQAFPENWRGRMHQARELGIAARTHAQPGELLIVAGDMNAGPYYNATDWQPPTGDAFHEWFHNALSYPLLLVYAGLVDAAIMGKSADDAVGDVTLGDTVVNDAKKSTATPGAADGWCDALPKTTLTAVDCNSLYFQQYAGTEFPARIDHIFVRDRPDLVVTDSKLLFTEPRDFAGVRVEPSDHYAVGVELLVDRAR